VGDAAPQASVAVVIPVHNGRSTIEAAVRSVQAQDYPAGQIVVVDDGSTDGTSDLLASLPGITLLRQSRRGPAAARNLGWRSASGAEYIFFLDADCQAPPRWISTLVEHHGRDPAGCVGCVYGLANPRSVLARIIYREFQRRYEFCGVHTSFIGSHGYSFRRDVLEAVGGYDESYRRASHEDNDLGWRLLRSGYRLRLVREVAVAHRFPESLLAYLRTQARHGFWRMKLLRSFPGSALGDEYSNPFDYLQPPLVLAAAGSLILGIRYPAALGTAGGFLAAALLLQAPVASGLRRLGSRRREILSYVFLLGPLRSFSRSLGMTAGLVWFWVLGKNSR
jgi:hypothetical protein